MTFPKRNRRTIVVDEQKFHWLCRGEIFADAYVRIQDASGQGGLLSVQFVGIVTPRHVAQAIRFARSHGWDPTGKKSVEIGGLVGEVAAEFEMKPEGASATWFFDRYPVTFTPAGATPMPATGRIEFLQRLPVNLEEVSGEDAGNRFQPEVKIQFTSDVDKIDGWLHDCKETEHAEPLVNGGEEVYELEPTGDYSYAQITVNRETGLVKVHCKLNLVPRR